MNPLTHYPLILLIILISLISASCTDGNAEKTVLYQQNKFSFTQKNANELIELAEYIGQSKLLASDKKLLTAWAIKDLKLGLAKRVVFYKALSNTVMTIIRNPATKATYRTELYLKFYRSFAKKTKEERLPNNFWAVVNRYNPPIQEALIVQRLQAQLTLQQLRLNQSLFNQTMRQHKASSDLVSKEQHRQSQLQSITLSGDTLLYELEDRFVAKDEQGKEYEVLK